MQMRESPPPLSSKKKDMRTSLADIRLQIFLAAGAILGNDCAEKIRPIEQPPRIATAQSDSGTYYPMPIPEPDADMETIMHSLQTVEDLEEFLKKNTEHENVGLTEFVRSYRRSPRELQQNDWKGPCNNFAEFTAEWAYKHGGIPYLISVWPEDVLQKFGNAWHQFTACKLQNGTYVIFDSRDVVEWKGDLTEYIRQLSPNWDTTPVNITRWRKTQENVRARWAQHLQNTCDENNMEPGNLPLRKHMDAKPADHMELALRS